MRLWHIDLLKVLPDKQLLSQHRECCALRGKGWEKNHSTIDYIFNYSPKFLYLYHLEVMEEMRNRGFNLYNVLWFDKLYRGKNERRWEKQDLYTELKLSNNIYKEHNKKYLIECCDNLIEKLKIKLEGYITKYGTLDAKTLKVSQELDRVINMRGTKNA